MTPEFIDTEREDKWSASSAERVHYCPGSPALIVTLPPEARDSSTAVAESGTRIHKAWETDDDSGVKLGELEIKERLNSLSRDAFLKWQEDILVPNLGEELGRCKMECQPILETRYWVRDEDGNKITSAKVDRMYVAPPFALIIDGKTGFKETTPAHRNFQSKVQAVAASRSLGYITHVRVAVAAHRFTSLLTQGDYDEQSLERALREVLWDDWKTKQPDASRVPGYWCNYCPARAGYCPEAAAYSMLPVAFSRSPLPPKPKKQDAIEAVGVMPVENVASIQRKASLIRNILDACSARLKSLPAEELAAVGFELQEGRNQLKVNDFTALTEHLYELLDQKLLTAEEFTACFEFKIGALEAAVLPRILKAAEEDGKKITAEAAKKNLRSKLANFISFDDPKNRTGKILKEARPA